MKIEIYGALCVRVFWTGVKNVAMLPEDILSTREIKQFLSKIFLGFLNFKKGLHEYYKPTFGPKPYI